MSETQKKGKIGERLASLFLLRKGYSIIRKNYRSLYGEIDLIAFNEREKEIVFVEVKLRGRGSLSSPLESVDKGKQERIRRTAMKFLSKTQIAYDSLRFDVIGIQETKDGLHVEHIENAF